MRVIATLFAFLAVANAFAPTPAGRANTQLSESLMDRVSNMLVAREVPLRSTHIRSVAFLVSKQWLDVD